VCRTMQGSVALFNCFCPSFAETSAVCKRCAMPPMILW
jgi:hypothetical protein